MAAASAGAVESALRMSLPVSRPDPGRQFRYHESFDVARPPASHQAVVL